MTERIGPPDPGQKVLEEQPLDESGSLERVDRRSRANPSRVELIREDAGEAVIPAVTTERYESGLGE